MLNKISLYGAGLQWRQNNRPWHSLSLVFAGQNIEKIMQGLAVGYALENASATLEHKYMWAAYQAWQEGLWGDDYTSRRDELIVIDGYADNFPPLLAKEEWLGALATAVSFYDGGEVLAQTLRKLDKVDLIAKDKLARFSPHLLRSLGNKDAINQALVKILSLWNKQDIDNPTQLLITMRKLINLAKYFTKTDFKHMPKLIKMRFNSLHLHLSLRLVDSMFYSVDSTDLATQQLNQEVDLLIAELADITSQQRYNGFGFSEDTAPDISAQLAAENVFVSPLSPFWQGQILSATDMEIIATERQQTKLLDKIIEATSMRAFNSFPRDGMVNNRITRRDILNKLIEQTIGGHN